MSFFRIDLGSGIPIYLQLKQQIKALIAMGRLRPGDKLPTIRQLAIDLRVNHLTILKAYEELEHDGILEMGPGHGTFVTERSLGLTEEEKDRRVKELLKTAVVEGVTLQMPVTRLQTLFTAVVQEIVPAGSPAPAPSGDRRDRRPPQQGGDDVTSSE